MRLVNTTLSGEIISFYYSKMSTSKTGILVTVCLPGITPSAPWKRLQTLSIRGTPGISPEHHGSQLQLNEIVSPFWRFLSVSKSASFSLYLLQKGPGKQIVVRQYLAISCKGTVSWRRCPVRHIYLCHLPICASFICRRSSMRPMITNASDMVHNFVSRMIAHSLHRTKWSRFINYA